MPVFLDREKLSPSYMPKRLLHRDMEKKLLTNMLKPFIESSSEAAFAKIQVLGGVGVGKTTLSLIVAKELTSTYKDLINAYVNLKGFSGGRVGIYRYLVRTVAEEAYSQSLSAEELLENLATYLLKTGKKLLVIFDETDQHVKINKGRDTVIYDFSRLHETIRQRPLNIRGVVFISRDPSYVNMLEKHEVSSLGAQKVVLEPYTAEQVRDILFDRVKEAFRAGAVPDKVIEYVAEVISKPPIKSDVRLALDILLYAGNLAELRGLEKVDIDMIRHVLSEIYPQYGVEEIRELSSNEKSTLLALAISLKQSGKAYVSIAEVERQHSLLVEEGLAKSGGVADALKALRQRGLVEADRSGGFGLAFIDAERLTKILKHEIGRAGPRHG